MIATLERAHALRALADRLPAAGGTSEEEALLRELADEQQQRAEYDAWVRAEVEAALSDPRPPLSAEEVQARLDALFDRLREGAYEEEYGFGSALHAAAKESGVADADVDALLAAMRASPARQPAEPVQLP